MCVTALNDAFVRAQDYPSSDSLRQVKDANIAAFPQLGEKQDDDDDRIAEDESCVRQVFVLPKPGG